MSEPLEFRDHSLREVALGTTEAIVVTAALALAALAGFDAFRWKVRRRARGVRAWVTGYLADRYGGPPPGLAVHCSDDPLWPVLADFRDPRTGARHRLQFACWGAPPAYALLSETEGEH